jgi:hypothetical protein
MKQMGIRKVLNNGVMNKKKVKVTFLTPQGYRTPQEIWIGEDNFNNELSEITKKSLLSKIEMNNRVFTNHPELLTM